MPHRLRKAHYGEAFFLLSLMTRKLYVVLKRKGERPFRTRNAKKRKEQGAGDSKASVERIPRYHPRDPLRNLETKKKLKIHMHYRLRVTREKVSIADAGLRRNRRGPKKSPKK